MKNTISDKEKTIIAVVQDRKSCKVLTTGMVTETLVKRIQLEKKVFLSGVVFDDLFIVEECVWNKDKTSVLIKVRTNKESEKYSLLTDFSEENKNPYAYLHSLEKKIKKSIQGEKPNTHVSTVLKKGKSRIAQKFGEEVVELVIEAAKENDELFKDEAADVFYYFLILLQERGFAFSDILKQIKLQKRKL
ncbi:MAG: phosphoribosyl-ATP diphosphatase [Flavobacteriaceae bacterium]|jgi:phosphoribosyl-ATP pyrophosphohydrolase/phosphoribosyl-AMP cyclohydrolase|nr:phosphoribosyl-ATP diphosphatase [Flavobacteriaceae bacterium]